MQSILHALGAFVEAHPALVWLLVTAAVSLFHDVIEPRFPALSKVTALVKSLGLDLPHAYQLARKMLPKLPPLPPGGPGGLGAVVTALVLTGCANLNGYDAITSAADVANSEAQLLTVSAQVLHDRCTVPMQRLADVPDTDPTKGARVDELAAQCDPAMASYDGARKSHEAAVKAIEDSADGKITIGDVFDVVENMTGSAADLTKKIEVLQ